MDGKSQKVDRDPIISSDTAARLAQYCPDLEKLASGAGGYDDPDITTSSQLFRGAWRVCLSEF